MSLNPLHIDQLMNLDISTKKRYIEMLGMVPEPNWQESLAKLLNILKQFRDSLADHDDDVMIRAIAVAKMLNKIIVDPNVAGGAFQYLEHNKRTLDIIALEQMMAVEDPKPF